MAAEPRKRARVSDRTTTGQSRNDLTCKRCRSRKVKCDAQYPACSGCQRADVACIVADWSTPREYTRSEVRDLEDKLRRLEDIAANTVATDSVGRPDSADGSFPAMPVHAPNDDNMPLRPVLGSGQPPSQLSFNRVLNPRFQPSSIFYHPPHPLPPHEAAFKAIENYFQRFHIAHPFLEQETILATLNSYHEPDTSLARFNKHRIFNLNMVLAIGSIKSFQDGQSDLHPFGFFTAALDACPPLESALDSIEDIECFLLIALFGVYYNIGCSIWELGRLCVRIAIELGLHQSHPSTAAVQHDPVQRCRIIFWECYMLDRFSSSTLGRPFAIDDSMITTELPVVKPVPSTPTHVSLVFNTLVKLSKINSQVHCFVLQGNKAAFYGHNTAYTDDETSTMSELFGQVRQFADELRNWRHTVPNFDQPSCVYETEEHFELLYQEARLRLIRAALDRLLPLKLAPDSLLRACLQSAHTIIMIFDKLRNSNMVTCTRAYAHLIFVASLVVALVIKSNLGQPAEMGERMSLVDVQHWLAELEDGKQAVSMSDAIECLHTSGNTLNYFSEQMPDVNIYAQFFEALRREIDPNDHFTMGNTARNLPSLVLVSEAQGDNGRIPDPPVPARHSPQIEVGLPLDSTGLHEPRLPESQLPFDPDMHMGELITEFFPSDSLPMDGQNGNMLYGMSWPFSSITGMEGVGSGISEYLWDMIPMWQESPSTSMNT